MDTDLIAELAKYDAAVREHRLSQAEAKTAYASLLSAYAALEYCERNLLRYLKHEAGLTYQQIAELLGAPNLTTRQAVFARWRNLRDSERRTTGSPVRGGRPKEGSRLQ